MANGEIIPLYGEYFDEAGKTVNMEAYQHRAAWESFAHPGTRIYERNCRVDENASIRILHFHPARRPNTLPLLLVPGLSSVIESFKGVLQEITRTHTVIYIETREKSSAETTADCRFNMEAISRDVEAAVRQAELRNGAYILVGYSLGAAAIMEAFHRLPAKPAHVVLAEPVPAFRMPAWSLPLARLAPHIYPVLKPFVKWYMRNFMIDLKKDAEIMRMVERALDNADPDKLGRTIRSIHRYEAWHRLPGLDSPTLIVATSKDTLHRHEDILRMKTLIAGSILVDLEDNQRSHSPEMGILLRRLSR